MVFSREDYLRSQQFTRLHKIVLGLTPGHQDWESSALLRSMLETSTAELENPDAHGRTVLHWAVTRGDVQIARMLLDFGANVDIADARGNYVIHKIFGLNGPGDVRDKRKHREQQGHDLSFEAEGEVRDDPELLEMLLLAGASPNCRNGRGETALHHTSNGNHRRHAKCLIQYGASGAAVDHQGRSALHKAILSKADDVLHELLSAKTKVKGRSTFGQNALHMLARQGTPAATRLLVAADWQGVDINDRDKAGDSAQDEFDKRSSKEALPESHKQAWYELLDKVMRDNTPDSFIPGSMQGYRDDDDAAAAEEEAEARNLC